MSLKLLVLREGEQADWSDRMLDRIFPGGWKVVPHDSSEARDALPFSVVSGRPWLVKVFFPDDAENKIEVPAVTY